MSVNTPLKHKHIFPLALINLHRRNKQQSSIESCCNGCGLQLDHDVSDDRKDSRVVQTEPLHCELQLHTFGFTQVPLFEQLGEQIATTVMITIVYLIQDEDMGITYVFDTVVPSIVMCMCRCRCQNKCHHSDTKEHMPLDDKECIEMSIY